MLRLMERQRLPRIPELFLGLAAIGIAVVLTAKIAAGAIHDARHRGDTITVTGSAHEPITSNLVRWAVTDSAVAATASEAAGSLEGDLAATRKFLGAAGVPDVAMSLGVASTEELVERLPKHQKRVTYRVSQTINVTTGKIDVVQRVSTRLVTGPLSVRKIAHLHRKPRHRSTTFRYHWPLYLHSNRSKSVHPGCSCKPLDT